MPLTELIRRDILNGHHRPGGRLELATISEDYDVSMMTVREALLQLVQQRLAVRTSHEEFQVVSVSRRDAVVLGLLFGADSPLVALLALGVYLWPMKRTRLPAALLVVLAAAILGGTSLLFSAF